MRTGSQQITICVHMYRRTLLNGGATMYQNMRVKLHPRAYLIFPVPIVSALGIGINFRQRLNYWSGISTQIDYFNRVSTEDHIAASLTLP